MAKTFCFVGAVFAIGISTIANGIPWDGLIARKTLPLFDPYHFSFKGSFILETFDNFTVVLSTYTDNGKKLRNFFIREFLAESIVK